MLLPESCQLIFCPSHLPLDRPPARSLVSREGAAANALALAPRHQRRPYAPSGLSAASTADSFRFFSGRRGAPRAGPMSRWLRCVCAAPLAPALDGLRAGEECEVFSASVGAWVVAEVREVDENGEATVAYHGGFDEAGVRRPDRAKIVPAEPCTDWRRVEIPDPVPEPVPEPVQEPEPEPEPELEPEPEPEPEPACHKLWCHLTPNEQAAAALCAAHLPVRLLALLRQPLCRRLVLALAARAFRLTFAPAAVSISGSGGNPRTPGMVLPTRLARRFNASTRC